MHAIDSIGAFSRPGATTVQIVTCTRNEIAKIHWRFNFCGLGTLVYSNRRFEEVEKNLLLWFLYSRKLQLKEPLYDPPNPFCRRTLV